MSKIFDAFRLIGPLAQAGGLTHDPKGKKPPAPPIVVWRHVERSPELAAWYERTIAEYRGAVEWIAKCNMDDSLGRNWVLYPKRIDAYSTVMAPNDVRDAMMSLWNAEPEFGAKALEDLDRLADHISTAAAQRSSGKD